MTKQRKTKLPHVIQHAFDTLNVQLKQLGYELVIRKPISKDLVLFDYALMFTDNGIKIYVDDELQQAVNHLLKENETVVIKSNWMSPDTVAITVPRMTQDAPHATESDGNSENVVE